MHPGRGIRLAVLGMCAAGLMVCVGRGQEKKADEGSGGGVAQVADVRVLTLKAIHFMHVSFDTTLQDLHEQLKTRLPEMAKTAHGAKLGTGMPMILILHGADGNPATKIKLDLGFQVPPGTEAKGDWKVDELAEYRCVSLVYSGPIARIGDAYEKLVPAASDNNRQPTDESRQMYLYWEGEDSPNNVVQVTIGVK